MGDSLRVGNTQWSSASSHLAYCLQNSRHLETYTFSECCLIPAYVHLRLRRRRKYKYLHRIKDGCSGSVSHLISYFCCIAFISCFGFQSSRVFPSFSSSHFSRKTTVLACFSLNLACLCFASSLSFFIFELKAGVITSRNALLTACPTIVCLYTGFRMELYIRDLV